MGTRSTAVSASNALKRPIELMIEATCEAAAGDVYGLLADPSSHLVWGGEFRGSSSRLLTVDGPRGPIGVGDEFSSTGADPMGGFADRSVVTEATPPRAFEFVTQATLTTNGGSTSVWTNVHRYEIEPASRGGAASPTRCGSRASAPCPACSGSLTGRCSQRWVSARLGVGREGRRQPRAPGRGARER